MRRIQMWYLEMAKSRSFLSNRQFKKKYFFHLVTLRFNFSFLTWSASKMKGTIGFPMSQLTRKHYFHYNLGMYMRKLPGNLFFAVFSHFWPFFNFLIFVNRLNSPLTPMGLFNSGSRIGSTS